MTFNISIEGRLHLRVDALLPGVQLPCMGTYTSAPVPVIEGEEEEEEEE